MTLPLVSSLPPTSPLPHYTLSCIDIELTRDTCLNGTVRLCKRKFKLKLSLIIDVQVLIPINYELTRPLLHERPRASAHVDSKSSRLIRDIFSNRRSDLGELETRLANTVAVPVLCSIYQGQDPGQVTGLSRQ